MDLSTFIVAVFCLIDDRLKERRIRSRGPTPTLSNSEVITIEVVGEFMGLDEDKKLFTHFRRHYVHYFPNLRCVHRTTFAGQAANLWKVKERLWQELLTATPHDPTFAICDSMPLPACLFARAYRCRRFRGEAAFGKDTLLRYTFYGFRVHVRVCWPGVITPFSVAPANAHKLCVLPELAEFASGIIVADRNYHSPKTGEELATIGVELLAPLLLQEARSGSQKECPVEPFSLPDRHCLFAAHRTMLHKAGVGARPVAPHQQAGAQGALSYSSLPAQPSSGQSAPTAPQATHLKTRTSG
jgi:hypothetical protein